jgi:hypothetical protein
MKIKRGHVSDKETQERKSDLISALEATESREKVRIKVPIPYETAEKVRLFFKEKGILENQGIPLLIQYGLSNESEEELEKLKNEMNSEDGRNLWGKYAVTKFEAYEYFMENKSMVMSLSRTLEENRMLKKRLKIEGLTKFIPRDEWDNWDDSTVYAYYQRYVFGRRQ